MTDEGGGNLVSGKLEPQSVVLIICLKKSGSQQGVILHPSKHLAMSGDIFFGHGWEAGAVTSSG